MKKIVIFAVMTVMGCSSVPEKLAAPSDAADMLSHVSIGSHFGDKNNRIMIVDTNATPPRAYFIHPKTDLKEFPGLPDLTGLKPGTVYKLTKDGKIEQNAGGYR